MIEFPRRMRAIAAITLTMVPLAVAIVWAADDNAAPAGSEQKEVKKENPYIPRKNLSAEDLQAYIERMQDAPVSIRQRPGFGEGMAIAAQRLLGH